jgi:hypothetical protein
MNGHDLRVPPYLIMQELDIWMQSILQELWMMIYSLSRAAWSNQTLKINLLYAHVIGAADELKRYI